MHWNRRQAVMFIIVIMVVSRPLNTCLIWPSSTSINISARIIYCTHFENRGWASVVRHHGTTTLRCVFMWDTTIRDKNLEAWDVSGYILLYNNRIEGEVDRETERSSAQLLENYKSLEDSVTDLVLRPADRLLFAFLALRESVQSSPILDVLGHT